MSIGIRGKTDKTLDRIIKALKRYEHDYPEAQIEIYRQNPASVRVRIIDPSFAKMGRPERNDIAWAYLDKLPDDVQSDISMLLLLTPEETKKSFANFEFEDPVPSNL